MTNRWMASALGLMLTFSMGLARPAAAFRLRASKPAPATSAPAPAGAVSTVKGIIKGAPAGKTFTVAQGKRTVTVDASKATIRSKGGRFASAAALTPGSYVSVQGTMNGSTLEAKTVEIVRPAGGGKKAAAGSNGSTPGGKKK